MRSEDRKRTLQATALRMLGEGDLIDSVTLRAVAARANMPLSSVTYVYSSRDELFGDLLHQFFQITDDTTFDGVGGGGLREELLAGAENFYHSVVRSPALVSLLRYSFIERASGRKDPIEGRDRAKAFAKLCGVIAERSGEAYRLTFDALGVVCQAQVDGMLLRYFEHGDTDQYFSDVLDGLEVVVLAADPTR